MSEGQLDRARTAGKTSKEKSESPSKLIDTRIEELPDWRGEVLSRIRGLITEADPDVVDIHVGNGIDEETFKSLTRVQHTHQSSIHTASQLTDGYTP